MKNRDITHLNPIAFLQTCLVQSIKLAGQNNPETDRKQINHIEFLGLTASTCLESAARKELGVTGPITRDQYVKLILSIKNRIGGNFSRGSSDPGVIRVENTCCPFGDQVVEAPELCRMTASVFGGIAARNFGYAKVELCKRIAVGDGRCEVLIYTEPALAAAKPGDEYRSAEGVIVSKTAKVHVSARVMEKMDKAWCANRAGGQRASQPAVIGDSHAMQSVLQAAEIVAPTMASVLISGETGVGKEVIARAIHALSGRSSYSWIAVNCGALPQDLMESLLFGHEKGAFTGAYDVHHGFFERAERGTLFLDEIDSLPLSAQAKLLRVLQYGEFERVGGKQALKADVRILAASNRNIDSLVECGAFRSDLYYRLSVFPIRIPPLRERRDDITGLVNHFLQSLAERYHTPPKILSEQAWTKAMRYTWPGNVRELENVLERAYLLSPHIIIHDLDLPMSGHSIGKASAGTSLKALKRQVASEAESHLLREALSQTRGNVTAVARQMHVTPRAIHQKLRLHGIDPATYRRPAS